MWQSSNMESRQPSVPHFMYLSWYIFLCFDFIVNFSKNNLIGAPYICTKEIIWPATVFVLAIICHSALNAAYTSSLNKRFDWIMKKSWGLTETCCGRKFRVCMACRAQCQATRERAGETCCFYIPQATSAEDFCFYTGRQFGDYICKKMSGEKKKEDWRNQRMFPPLIM